MKKLQIIALLLILMLLNLNSVFADETNKNFEGFKFKTKTSTESAQSASKKAVNKAIMKSQIVSIKSKINNTNALYKSAADALVINILPSEQLQKYQDEKQKINKNSTANQDVALAEYSTLRLNKFFKSFEVKDSFQNLTIAQKIAVRKNLLNLKYVSGSYSQIINQAKTLTESIKADKAAALELKADITDLLKMQLTITNQVKSVNKLIDNLENSAAKAGLSL